MRDSVRTGTWSAAYPYPAIPDPATIRFSLYAPTYLDDIAVLWFTVSIIQRIAPRIEHPSYALNTIEGMNVVSLSGNFFTDVVDDGPVFCCRILVIDVVFRIDAPRVNSGIPFVHWHVISLNGPKDSSALPGNGSTNIPERDHSECRAIPSVGISLRTYVPL
jgi:hypothetical protein